MYYVPSVSFMRLPRSSSQRPYTLAVILLVVALLMVLLDQSGRLGTVRTYAQTWLSPVLNGFSQLSQRVGGVRQDFGDTAQLRNQVKDLEAQISALEQEHIRSQALVQENEQLRKQLGIQQEKPWKLLSADVATATPDAGRHVILLTVGSNDGVAVGMAVIGQTGSSPPALIGIVDSVGPHAASVLLITDGSSALSSQVYHEGIVANGVVKGQWQRGSRLQIEQVDRAQTLTPGDVVTTAGLTARLGLDLPRAAIPRGVPIGTIESVTPDGHGQLAAVRPYVDPDQVRYAWIILGHDG